MPLGMYRNTLVCYRLGKSVLRSTECKESLARRSSLPGGGSRIHSWNLVVSSVPEMEREICSFFLELKINSVERANSAAANGVKIDSSLYQYRIRTSN